MNNLYKVITKLFRIETEWQSEQRRIEYLKSAMKTD